MKNEIEPHKGILGILTRHFNFSTDTLEERQRLQKTVYILQAGGAKLGYGFGWYVNGPMSSEIVNDCREVLHYSEYEETKDPSKWNFNKDSWKQINETKERFIEPADTPRKLELLASFHMFYSHWHRDEGLLPYELKQKFRESKTKTFSDDSPITDEQLHEAYVQASNLIAYENFHEVKND
jgi:uncharacterized protein YwgA